MSPLDDLVVFEEIFAIWWVISFSAILGQLYVGGNTKKLQSVIERFGSVEKALESLIGGNRISTIEIDKLDKTDDDDYQLSIESQRTPVELLGDQPILVSEHSTTPVRRNSRKRDAAIALRAIINANYKCEIDPEHKTFLSKVTGQPFVEAHHLIPMSAQDQFFPYSLDVPANIVSLCPNCHRAFHHALPKERKELINKVYQKRKTRLRNCKIALKEEEVLNYYV